MEVIETTAEIPDAINGITRVKLFIIFSNHFYKHYTKFRKGVGKVNEILNAEKYTSLVVETEDGKKIAEITLTEAIPAEGYVVRLTPKYD
ncbi:TPA: hypothetical protein TY283_001265 [Streptococcus suis]|nr:hypothetical protein [Streptococcus suis]